MASSSDGDQDRPWQSYHTVYTNAKAGMDNVDKEKVQRIVYEMSKGSKYFENEQRKEALMKQKIDIMHRRCTKLTEKDITHYQTIACKRIQELEASCDLSKVWMHCDMDAFYAAVETLENPSLKGKPLAVGNMAMICTANYEARKFGVRAAMPGFIAYRLCPDLIFVPPNFQKYTYYSELTRKVFHIYDPDFITTGLDEGYLNITDACEKRQCGGEEIAKELRETIYRETGLTCSTGVAPNRLLAKVCSDINKPNGQFILPNDRKAVLSFISSLPIRKVGGIGKVTESVLRNVLGINTCEEILQKSAFLFALFSLSTAEFFLSIGLGLGGTDTPEHRSRKSISTERTFSATDDEELLLQKLADTAVSLSSDMQKEHIFGRTLTLKLKTASFEVRTRAVSLPKYIQSKEEILGHASKLLKAELPLSVRLMGLRMSHFKDGKEKQLDPTQKTLKNFILSGENSMGTKCAHGSTCSDTSDQELLHTGEIENGCIDESCFFHDGLSMSHSFNTEDVLELDQSVVVQNSNFTNDMKTKNATYACLLKSTEQFPKKAEDIHDRDIKQEMIGEEGKPSWVDGYICSCCGIELPPSFIEERQEHLDYHLAEMIQKEESLYGTDHLSREWSVQKSLKASGTRKKQKSSKEKYIPIDAFFMKDMKSA